MHDYKSLHIAVMICATLVNTQTHRQTAFNRYAISSDSRAKIGERIELVFGRQVCHSIIKGFVSVTVLFPVTSLQTMDLVFFRHTSDVVN